MRRRRLLIIGAVIAVFIVAFSVHGITTAIRNYLVLDSLMRGNNLDYGLDESNSLPIDDIPDIDLENGYLNKFHQMAMDIDESKIAEFITTTGLQIPDSYYNLQKNGKVDYVGELETYKLICEILTRKEINPSDSPIKIMPYHIYGTWYNETGMRTFSDKIPFNPYDSLIKCSNSYGYMGPFQMSPMYQLTTPTDSVDIRMYGYISAGENQNAQQRVLRIQNFELYNPTSTQTGIVSDSYDPVNALDTIKQQFNDSIKYDKYRPNPEYLPDAMYTLVRKLRTVYTGRDLYTLNPSDRHQHNLSNLEKQYNSIGTTLSSECFSDLNYLYAIQLNSGYVGIHTYTDDGNISSNYSGLMPKLYINMLKKYSSLDVTEIGLINKWSDSMSIPTVIAGYPITPNKNFANQNIVYKNNLVDQFGLRDEFQAGVGSLNIEYSLTSTYGLRCIANGKMIESGVEYMIQTVYTWEKTKGYLKSSTQPSDEIDDIPDAVGNFKDIVINGKVVITAQTLKTQAKYLNAFKKISPASLPFTYKSDYTWKVTHDFYCNNNFYCTLHPGFTHDGMDVVFIESSSKKIVMATILSVADGTIQDVTYARYGSLWGNSVKLKHTYAGVVYYTRYAHLATLEYSTKNIGDFIHAGTKLGIEGSTGNSTGPHLHFGISVQTSTGELPLNPKEFLESR